MVFRDSLLVFRQVGALAPDVLDELLDKVRALDMVTVRRKLQQAVSPR
jgi:hypothetical protein